MGTANDFGDLVNHEFFASLSWADLEAKRIQPPFKPNVKDEMDIGQVDKGIWLFEQRPLAPYPSIARVVKISILRVAKKKSGTPAKDSMVATGGSSRIRIYHF